MADMPGASHPAGANQQIAFTQVGRTGPFIGLSIKILLLTIVTATIYRFWGRAEVRRALWGSTLINGEPLDYVGKGSELLIGFLIALVLYLLPIGLATQLIPIVAGPDTTTKAAALQGGLSFAYALVFYYLLSVGLYQALRYRLSRTLWQGIRFSLTGSAFGFGLKLLGLYFLNLLLLGWLTPVVDMVFFRGIARNMHFGDKPFHFDGKPGRLYGPFALSYLLAAIGIGLLAAGVGLSGRVQEGLGEGGQPGQMLIGYLILVGLGMFALAALASAIYIAAKLRAYGNGLSYEGLRFHFDVGTFSYVWLVLTNGLILILSLGLLLPLTELRRFRYIFSRLTTSGTVDLGGIGPNTGPRPRFGEGLAEAFGLGNV
jgi:uncharacterized membrane protein YjgN (DUF898 family)